MINWNFSRSSRSAMTAHCAQASACCERYCRAVNERTTLVKGIALRCVLFSRPMRERQFLANMISRSLSSKCENGAPQEVSASLQRYRGPKDERPSWPLSNAPCLKVVALSCVLRSEPGEVRERRTRRGSLRKIPLDRKRAMRSKIAPAFCAPVDLINPRGRTPG